MVGWVSSIFSQSGFMPHVHCYLAKPALVWTMFTTDLLIGLSYMLISMTLWALLRKVKVQFNFIIFCFGVFIAACGGTHLMELWTLWHPIYWVSAAVKAITATASVGTAIYLVRLRKSIVTMAEGAKLSEERRRELEALTLDLEKRVEARTRELQKSEERFRHTFERAPVGIAHIGMGGKWLRVNPMLCEIIGYSEAELFQKKFGDIVHPDDLAEDGSDQNRDHLTRDDLDRDVGMFGALLKGGVQSLSTEKRFLHKNGDSVWVLLTSSMSQDENGDPEYFICCVDDITEAKRVEEELKEAVRARDEFLSIASHELKTPITAMKMQTGMMKRAEAKRDARVFTPERVMKLVDQSDRSLDRLVRLVDDMLDISRIKTGKLMIQPEQMSLSALVQEVLERYRPQIEIAECELTFQCDEGVTGHWDRFRIEQVITNLLTNATRYGAKKPIHVSLKRDSDGVLLCVRDEGIGIPKESLERIFQRFERAVSANEFGGLGLGLYISRQIVEMHGGSISVVSELGRGSAFTVKLPA